MVYNRERDRQPPWRNLAVSLAQLGDLARRQGDPNYRGVDTPRSPSKCENHGGGGK